MTFWKRFKIEALRELYRIRVDILALGWAYAVIGLLFNLILVTIAGAVFLVLGWIAHNENWENYNDEIGAAEEARQ